MSIPAASDAAAWRVAFEQAWEAHRCGSVGVGAVVVDADGEVVVADRNRSAEAEGPPGLLAGNRLAHAEVNALARLGHTMPTGMRLLATLQPCVLCAGACSFARVPHVEYAAANPGMVSLACDLAEDAELGGLDLDAAFARWSDRLTTVPATRPGR